ncbi:hypothetical protein ACWD33_20525 [Streptomyces xiamenensis]|uniref:hypothetical protein n=1 Tax=Streptomyces xiamenensis TaxID=408015 RepID=UPI0006289774|nr:hypothetical protein [Streptomyces xiamenensis]
MAARRGAVPVFCGALALVAVALLPAADAAPAPGPAVPDRKGDTFLTAESGGVLAIEGGECFTDPARSPAAGEVMVRYVPCDEEGAANQVYGFVAAPDGAFDRERVAAFARESCGRGFRTYWPGEAAAGLDFYPVLPTAATWDIGDRDVMCVAYRPGSPLTGSLLPLASALAR